jgi:DNA-binding NtrC family response regulator
VEEALVIIQKHVPAMVVTDVRMPGASGIELLRMARKAHPGLPFLLVTAYADVRDAVNAMKLGAVDYLSKPVDLDELLAAVRDAVGIPRYRSDSPDAGIVTGSHAQRFVGRLSVAQAMPMYCSGESGGKKS